MSASPLPPSLADLGVSSDELLQVLLNISQTGIMLLRPVYTGTDEAAITDFHWVYLNPAAQQLTGMPQQPAESLLTRFPETLGSGMFDFYRATFASGQVERRRQAYLYSTTNVTDTAFELVAHRRGAVLVVDFTDVNTWSRPAVEAALHEAQTQKRLLYQVLEQLPAAVAILDGPEHRFSFFNEQYYDLTDKRVRLNQTLAELLPEADSPGLTALLNKVYTTGEPFIGTDMPVRLRDSATGQPTLAHFDNVYQPFFKGQDQPQGILAFMVNTTEKVRARAAADASAQQLRVLTDALPALIAYVDRNYRYRFVNQSYRQWFGRELTTINGCLVREVVGEAAFAAGLPYMRRVLAGERVSFEARLPYRTDLVKYVHADYIPDLHQGETVGFYALITDVTEQTLAREQMQSLNEELAVMNEELQATNEELNDANLRLLRTNKDLDSFVYTASHDLKAPISNLEALLTALREELPPAALAVGDVAMLLDMMSGATGRFRQTLSHLTSVAKLQNADLLPAEAVNLPSLVQDVCLDLRLLLDTTGASLTLNLDACPHVQFAPQHLRSIIYNLLSNAVKYHAPGCLPLVYIHAYRTSTRTILSVQDNGLGLSEAQQGKIFGLFRRMHDHVEGSGVGLYVVKKIVENAGGTVTVRSQPGQGSTFTVMLPR